MKIFNYMNNTNSIMEKNTDKVQKGNSQTNEKHTVGTPGGIRVRPGILAVDALNLMQSRHITSVMVADGDRLLGVLHMHDLLRAGVV